MKKRELLFMMGIVLLTSGTVKAQVGVGTTAPNASAQLDVTSANKGLLVPRMTTAQRNAISNPATGLIVFNTTTNALEINTGVPATPSWGGVSVAAANGLSVSGGNVVLGGTLTAATTVNQSTFPLTFNGTGGQMKILSDGSIYAAGTGGGYNFHDRTRTSRYGTLFAQDGVIGVYDSKFNGKIMEMDSLGRVGIGITPPTASYNYKLRVAGGVDITESAANQFALYVTNNFTTGWGAGISINIPNIASGSTFMNFMKGTNTLGYVQYSGSGLNYATTSDIRLKDDIKPTHFGISDVMKVQVKDYVFKADRSVPQTGFLAQQLYEIYPIAVIKGGEDASKNPWTVDYSKLTPLLVKAIQDQQMQIEQLAKRIEQLEQDRR
ncbi:MAG: hypothetical protein DI535_22755 [Citrobacter freundii]|nr:MAG: hypothetical protein DI535_22755 [Citrobacter freundii]